MSENTAQNNGHLDSELRPLVWEDYVGQTPIKESLRILTQAASGRGEPPEHILFYGPPGLGKTTLAYLVARDIGAQVKVTSGPAIEKVGDIAAILTNLSPGDILFIDEIHRLNKTIEEVLYPAMESGALNIVIGKGPSARTIQLDLPPLTIVAATTKMAGVSGPLRSRFSGGTFRLEYYSDDEIGEIIRNSAKKLGVSIDGEAVAEIARRSRNTPRIANHLLKRVRDYAEVNGKDINEDTVAGALNLAGIDESGLSAGDRKVLETIVKKFSGGPVGLSTIAASMNEEQATIEDVHEPYLLQMGLIERTPRGRVATRAAYELFDLEPPQTEQGKLI